MTRGEARRWHAGGPTTRMGAPKSFGELEAAIRYEMSRALHRQGAVEWVVASPKVRDGGDAVIALFNGYDTILIRDDVAAFCDQVLGDARHRLSHASPDKRLALAEALASAIGVLVHENLHSYLKEHTGPPTLQVALDEGLAEVGRRQFAKRCIDATSLPVLLPEIAGVRPTTAYESYYTAVNGVIELIAAAAGREKSGAVAAIIADGRGWDSVMAAAGRIGLPPALAEQLARPLEVAQELAAQDPAEQLSRVTRELARVTTLFQMAGIPTAAIEAPTPDVDGPMWFVRLQLSPALTLLLSTFELWTTPADELFARLQVAVASNQLTADMTLTQLTAVSPSVPAMIPSAQHPSIGDATYGATPAAPAARPLDRLRQRLHAAPLAPPQRGAQTL